MKPANDRFQFQEKSDIVKTFGQRMTTAREMCGLTGLQAAALLGYQNSSKLSKIEHASDGDTIPSFLPYKASIVYNCSIDYLFGLSDDWQRDPVTAQECHIQRALEQVTVDENNAIRDLFDQLSKVEQAATVAFNRFGEIKRLVNRFREINPEFDELKLGAKLLRVVEETHSEILTIGRQLEGHYSSSQYKT
ncbi:helix-turn-helix domain-containing protein [Methylomonas sp. 2BW1-5-20]|uniref:helix-turn-helix domain-containing protein n=1 Tax=Methylomonas sp. 2BW1-5-20 TaxID=3376686 RepID=UPI00404C7CFC